ncbi:hypothetical protein A2U01_0035910 [Trifolium medium]|uniref:Uncharacterized protein n=1 Tax=Trifolium medium TaxID=97028 RepID=A0A392PRP6_9FABA|nr:hypothetical protein [Trifolium medium]
MNEFYNMIDDCNMTWVEEFYANSYGREADDYTSYRRARGQTEDEFVAMLHELALPGKDWRYNSSGERSRLQATEMEPIAK